MSLTDKQRRLVDSFLDARVTRFRRSDVVEVLYRSVTPRDRQRATALADAALRCLARDGRIAREGHLHWQAVRRHRTLLNGQRFPERDDLKSMNVTTRVPEKWVLVDLETGDLWQGTPGAQWERATAQAVAATADILAAHPKGKR